MLWIAFRPGLAIFLTVFAYNLVAKRFAMRWTPSFAKGTEGLEVNSIESVLCHNNNHSWKLKISASASTPIAA